MASARQKIIDFRNNMMITQQEMADKLNISELLLDMIESGHVTHPKIAKRIQKLVKLTDKEMYELVPKIHDPNSPEYDPYKFVLQTEFNNDRMFIIEKMDE